MVAVSKNAVPETESAVDDAYVSVAFVPYSVVAVNAVDDAYGNVDARVEVAKTYPTVGDVDALRTSVPPRDTEPPPVRSPAELMVTDELASCAFVIVPESKLAPMEVVATTLPVLSVPRSEEVRLVRYVLPETVNAVLLAYGNVEAATVEVAVKMGAVNVLYAVRMPRKSELPYTSKMLPVVEVAEAPIKTTFDGVET